MALTPLQGDLLLDVSAARKSADPDQLTFAIDVARVHGCPEDLINKAASEPLPA